MRKSVIAVTLFFMQAIFALLLLLSYLYWQLPDISQLRYVTYKEPLKIYAKNGESIAQFGEIHRIPIAIVDVPETLVQALLATEDQRFYQHHGIDLFGLLRAVKSLVSTGKKRQGASTITMQVARNFFLGREKTYWRKVNEILLAIAIENSLSKNEILELYLNKIYFGQRAYGVAAAARNYFAKDLAQLSLAECAMLAGIPKAPSENNPVRNLTAAIKRRNFVLGKMHHHGYINDYQYQQALHEEVHIAQTIQQHDLDAGYMAELTRSMMVEAFGESAYQEGYKVVLSIDADKQRAAQRALAKGLDNYDKTQGWRSSKQNYTKKYGKNVTQWLRRMQSIYPTDSGKIPAVVLDVGSETLLVLGQDKQRHLLNVSADCWLDKRCNSPNHTRVTTNDFAINIGDEVLISQEQGEWKLAQAPAVQGALVAINPASCKIEALVGGYQFQRSNFNRALQGYRQPGSVIKPLMFALALENGYNMATQINDAPIVEEDSTGDSQFWRPKNVDHQFKGPIRLRQALIQSRNLVSVRLLQDLGVQNARSFFGALGFVKAKQPPSLSLALGSGLVTPLQLAKAYTIFAKEGQLCSTHWVELIKSRSGHVIDTPVKLAELESKVLPKEVNNGIVSQVISPETAYIISHALHDVVRYGTARHAKELHREDIYGKTGSTNDNMDAWFAGFNKSLVATVWVGDDGNKSVHLPGAKLALPIWVDFMRDGLDPDPDYIRTPKGIISVRINRKTGRAAQLDDEDSMFEIFNQNNPVPTPTPQDHGEEQLESSMEQIF